MCERSGLVREAFGRRGHDAWSLDTWESEKPGQHIRGNVLDYALASPFWRQWDVVVAFPPCTHLAVSGARWFNEKRAEQTRALAFVRYLLETPVLRLCIENPVSIISSKFRKPDQIIQPWMFGHGECKATCLWLWGLPPLKPTNVVAGRKERVFRLPPSPTRSAERSRTYQGIADAMAEQWG